MCTGEFLYSLILSFNLTLDIIVKHLFGLPSGRKYVLSSRDRRCPRGVAESHTKHNVSLLPSK